ncbi:MAG: adenine deaminase [Deltaproteobacteria bacterium]|nr:adenine deaminase [Deltaproteobacteria bacterium]
MDLAIHHVTVPDFRGNRLVSCHVGIDSGRIVDVSQTPPRAENVVEGKGGLLTPGLMDAHVHVESSFLTPARFGEVVARHGTLYAVADCHEIANVAGIEGLQWFMEDAGNSPAMIRFAVPSCVPASPFGTSGGTLGVSEVARLLADSRVVSLGELMNVPGVLNRDEALMAMIRVAKARGKRVNGHAPGLSGDALRSYFDAGAEDDHETSHYDELKERLALGVHVFLREGSGEHTQPDAYRVIDEHPDRVLFCTDDKTLHDVESRGHLTEHLRKAASLGVDTLNLLRAACYNGPAYYGIPDAGQVVPGYRADLVLFRDARDFEVGRVIVAGRVLEPAALVPPKEPPGFLLDSLRLELPPKIPAIPGELLGVAIGAKDGSLLTEKVSVDPSLPEVSADEDLLKLVVLERYGHGNRAACRIRGFGLKRGAIASSLAHDCHNIVAVGADDASLALAVEAVAACGGGLSVVDGGDLFTVPLPVGGIVSDAAPDELLSTLGELARRTRLLGTSLTNAHATLSFMALEVIPHLKLTDRGLFDVGAFRFVGEPW